MIVSYGLAAVMLFDVLRFSIFTKFASKINVIKAFVCAFSRISQPHTHGKRCWLKFFKKINYVIEFKWDSTIFDQRRSVDRQCFSIQWNRIEFEGAKEQIIIVLKKFKWVQKFNTRCTQKLHKFVNEWINCKMNKKELKFPSYNGVPKQQVFYAPKQKWKPNGILSIPIEFAALQANLPCVKHSHLPFIAWNTWTWYTLVCQFNEFHKMWHMCMLHSHNWCALINRSGTERNSTTKNIWFVTEYFATADCSWCDSTIFIIMLIIIPVKKNQKFCAEQK